jgi:arylsulfatase A-like enzyme
VDAALHYQTDLAATIIELAGGQVPALWDGCSIVGGVSTRRGSRDGDIPPTTSRDGDVPPTMLGKGRSFLVCGNCAWSCQRSVRWDDWLLLRTYHDGLKDLPPVLLFSVADDPHLTRDLAPARHDLVHAGLARLHHWETDMMSTSESDVDPLWTVIREGGPYHTRGRLAAYCERLRATGRAHHAESLLERHGHWMK